MPDRRRQPRSRAFWWLWSIAACALLGLGLMAMPAAAPRPAASARDLPPGYDVLQDKLLALRGALLPRQREAVLATLRSQVDALVPPLLWVLARPKDELFAATADLARVLGLTEAVEPLAAVVATGRGPVRAAALSALEGLQPLDDDTLAAVAGDAADDADLAMALLAIVDARAEPCAAAVQIALNMLRHADARVRGRVPAALPPLLAESCAATLVELADDPMVEDIAVPLLPRLEPTPATIDILVQRLATVAPERQQALLAVLDRHAAAEPVAAMLWDLAIADGPVAVRAAALSALECAGSSRPLPDDVNQWPAQLRYQAARLRIRGGHRDGVDMLVGLLDEPDAEGSASGPARMLLSRLSKLPPHATAEAFAAWSAKQADVPAMPPR